MSSESWNAGLCVFCSLSSDLLVINSAILVDRLLFVTRYSEERIGRKQVVTTFLKARSFMRGDIGCCGDRHKGVTEVLIVLCVPVRVCVCMHMHTAIAG